MGQRFSSCPWSWKEWGSAVRRGIVKVSPRFRLEPGQGSHGCFLYCWGFFGLFFTAIHEVVTGTNWGCKRMPQAWGWLLVCPAYSSSEGLLYGLQERTPVTSTTRWGPAGYLWKLCPGKNVQICCLFPASRPPQPLSCPGSLPRLFPWSARSALELNLGASRMPNPGSCPSPWCPHTLPWVCKPHPALIVSTGWDRDFSEGNLSTWDCKRACTIEAFELQCFYSVLKCSVLLALAGFGIQS